MRRGIWILAIGGLMGLALGVGNADEREGENPFAFDTPETSTSGSLPRTGAPTPGAADRLGSSLPGLPSRYSRRLAEAQLPPSYSSPRGAAPGARNYYDQLFGGEKPKAAAAEEPIAGKMPANALRSGARPSTGNNPFAGDFAPEVGQKPSGVVQAKYNRAGTLPRFGEIQQVRAADNDNPFAAPPTEPQTGENPPAAPEPPVSNSAPAVPAAVSVDSTSTGPQSPTVTVQWVKKTEINVGRECVCELLVKNSGKVSVRDVEVQAYFPRTVRLLSAEPNPQSATDHLAWTVPMLEPGAEHRIQVTMIPNQRGELATSAFVRFTGAASGAFSVEEPMLKVAVQGPTDVALGDPASQTVILSNPGNGVTRNVTIEAHVPAGLEHPRGERLTMSVGSLNPGEARQVRLGLIATKGGRHALQIEARADGNLTQQTVANVNVIAPSVHIAMDGPGLRYVGRSATYELTVTNDGTAASNNVRVTHHVPDGFKFLNADHGGQFDSLKQTINWFVGRLEPGQTVKMKVELEATVLGKHVHTVAAVSEHGTSSEAKFDTMVDGISSLVLDIVELDDPVEVGAETAYEIRVKNDGSKAAESVALACELPDGVTLVGAKGPADYRVAGGQIVFSPLKALEPGKAALYRVHVRGTKPGSHRFRAQLKSDSIDEPLSFEELTRFYGEE